MPHISIKAETIFHIFSFPVTNSYITAIIVILLTLICAVFYKRQIFIRKKSGFFYFMHFIFKTVYDLFGSIVGEKISIFFPLLLSFFLYILLQNWFGLFPGIGSILIKVKEGQEDIFVPILRGNNADLNATIGLALISVFFIQYYGISFLGIFGYLKKFLNFSNPINFFIGILDILSEFSRIISFAFRLFGNIFAGEVLLIVIAFLIPVLVPFPFLMLEIFVGFIQALVFAMLTTVFINMAIQKQH
jgi:F-type H+-transporting ATPase subunit a